MSGGSVREIISPKYPLHYPTNTKCTWAISTDAGNVISITFVDFETEPINDVVDIRDGAKSTDQLMGRLSGARTGRTFISTGSKITIKFTSDLANARRGFKAIIRGGMCFNVRCFIHFTSLIAVVIFQLKICCYTAPQRPTPPKILN